MPAAPARRRSSSSSRRWVWIAGAAAVALVAVFLIRRHNAAASGFDTSGTPRAGQNGSAAQEPSGGAAGIPDNLPVRLVGHPDELQTQVQQTDAGGETTADVPTSSPSGYSYIGPAQTVNGTPVTQTAVIGGQGYEQSSPGSDFYRPVPLSEAAPTSNIKRPGLQM